MNKDLLLLTLLVAVVLIAGAVYFLFLGGDVEDPDFVPADTDHLEADEDVEVTRRTPDRPRPELPADPAKPAAEGVRTVTVEEPQEGVVTGTLFGRVTDPDGLPVPEANVALCLDVSEVMTQSLQGAVRATVVTDENGNYEMTGVPIDDRYVMRVDDRTFATKFMPLITLTEGERRQVNIKLSLGLALMGVVTDNEGTPLKDVEVMVFDQQNRSEDPTLDVERALFSDETGRFEFNNLNPGFKRVTARKPGYASKTELTVQVLRGKKAKELSFKLGAGSRILGLVLDEDTQEPLEGITVSAQPVARVGAGMSSANYPPLKTDSEGRFIYEGLAVGAYKLRFFGRGYGRAGRLHPARTSDEETTFVLKRMPVARGRVIDEETGEAITRFTVLMSRQEQLVVASSRLSQKFNDDDGNFEYIDIGGKHPFYLFAEASGYAGGRSVQLTPQEDADVEDVEIRMYKGSVAKGRVVDTGGNGVAGATVSIVPVLSTGNSAGDGILNMLQKNMRTARRVARTDGEGKFEVSGIPEGKFKLIADHSSFAETATESVFTMPRSGEVAVDDVVMMKGGVISGIVRNDEGEVEPNTRVQLTEKGQFGGNTYMGTTNERGEYRIDKIRPGIYTIRLLDRGGAPDLNDIFSHVLNPGSVREIVIGDGDEQKMDLD